MFENYCNEPRHIRVHLLEPKADFHRKHKTQSHPPTRNGGRHRRPNVPEFWQKPTKIDPMINSVPIREDRISMPHFRGHFIAPLKCPLLGNLNHNGAMEVNLSFKIGCNTGAAQVSARKEV